MMLTLSTSDAERDVVIVNIPQGSTEERQKWRDLVVHFNPVFRLGEDPRNRHTGREVLSAPEERARLEDDAVERIVAREATNPQLAEAPRERGRGRQA